MIDTEPAEEATLFPKTAGERLREAREAQGLALAEIAARTRVPVRQLEAIETSNYAALPSITYSVGFAKAYARAVGLDEVAIAKEVRGSSDQPGARRTDYEAYEIDEPSRVPSGGLAIFGVVVAVLLLVAAGLWYGTSWFRGDENAPAPSIDAPSATVPQAAQPAPIAVPAPGQVTLTATDEVWLKVYDAAGTTLFQNTLKPGEKYDVPSAAQGPMINVGRPDKLQVTVNGTAVPALGDGRVAIKDVGISAAALAARGTPSAPAASAAAPSASPPSAAAPAASTGTTRRTAAPPRERRAELAPTSSTLNIAAPAPVVPEPVVPVSGATPAP